MENFKYLTDEEFNLLSIKDRNDYVKKCIDYVKRLINQDTQKILPFEENLKTPMRHLKLFEDWGNSIFQSKKPLPIGYQLHPEISRLIGEYETEISYAKSRLKDARTPEEIKNIEDEIKYYEKEIKDILADEK